MAVPDEAQVRRRSMLAGDPGFDQDKTATAGAARGRTGDKVWRYQAIRAVEAVLLRAHVFVAAKQVLARYRALAYRFTPGYRRMVALYARFVRPGDLCFDIGANLGLRTVALLGTGARVIAVEPQASCLRHLQTTFRRDRRVTVVPAAVGDHEGEAELAVCERAPTISTLSERWMTAGVFAREYAWTQRERVRLTTLDALIARYGVPAFCKIDVEGYEASVLAGLSRPIPALSFEFQAGSLDDAEQCVRRLADLDFRRLNFTLEEGTALVLDSWATAGDVLRAVAAHLPAAPEVARRSWGELYARQESGADGLAVGDERPRGAGSGRA